MLEDNRPVGWWLKHLDRLIEDSFERLLSAERLSRRDWQALNAIGDGVPIATVERELAPFLPDPPARAGAVSGLLDDLCGRGLIVVDGATAVLTPEGSAARRRVGAEVDTLRARLATGIGAGEYRVMIAVLRRMAGNLA